MLLLFLRGYFCVAIVEVPAREMLREFYEQYVFGPDENTAAVTAAAA